MSLTRIQKTMASTGLYSRREADELIREGRVRVNGKVAVPGTKADPAHDSIKIDGKSLRVENKARRYLLLNKPRGYLTTTSDPEGRPTVMDLLPARLRKGLKPVGRLDLASEGLLILTDDGDFAQTVAHPSRGASKTYLVKVWKQPREKDLERLRRGILLDGRRTAPCEIDFHHATGRGEKANVWFTVILHEGRTRQIRRMFETVGHKVSKLRRVAIGTLQDDRLTPGAYRPLTAPELRKFDKPGSNDHRP